MKEKNNFYSWLDQIAAKKADDWSVLPMKPLSPDEVYTEMLNDPTYNYKTFYDMLPFNAEQMLTADPEAHFTDVGKTMYHPTFSDESAYSGYINDYNPYGITGGHWNEEGNEYTPSLSQLANYWNYNRTRDYLNKSGGKNVKISLPKYKHGSDGPSLSIRKYIADAEGSHFAGLNKRWGGDAVGTFYKRLGKLIGADAWEALNQNQRDALTSYYYNIKPSSFDPTLRAIQDWNANNRTYDGLGKIMRSINIGMNNPKLKGLRKRRLYELGLFMQGINPTGVVNGNLTQEIPLTKILIPMDEQQITNTVSTPIYPNIRSTIEPYIRIPLKPQLYPDLNPDGTFNK